MCSNCDALETFEGLIKLLEALKIVEIDWDKPYIYKYAEKTFPSSEKVIMGMSANWIKLPRFERVE